MFRNHRSFLSVLMLSFAATPAAIANDFPTIDRVQFVYECMALHGGENYANLYSCACTLDRIAERLSYNEYVVADSYVRMENMRGERGGLFRSSDDARRIRNRFKEMRSDAEKQCFVKRPPADASPAQGRQG
jgi:hypothetical protein